MRITCALGVRFESPCLDAFGELDDRAEENWMMLVLRSGFGMSGELGRRNSNTKETEIVNNLSIKRV